MQVHQFPENLPVFKHAIVTIGTYDGVHAGHQQIIQQLKTEAAHVDGETVIITFNPHPRKVVGKKTSDIKLINTLPEKIRLLDQQGIDHLVIVPFTTEFANQPARDYIAKFLVEKFHPHTIIIGYDHQFGHNREGDYKLLEAVKDEYDFKVKEIPEHILHNSIISSTRIRQAILDGNIVEANTFLGYPYFFDGTVVEGNKLGRTLGYPTANLHIQESEKLVPGNGVYAVLLDFSEPDLAAKYTTEGKPKQGMMNIGVRPTIGGSARMIEVNIFDFDEDIYGKTLRVQVIQRLRGEVKFSGLDALKKQLALDKEGAIAVLDTM